MADSVMTRFLCKGPNFVGENFGSGEFFVGGVIRITQHHSSAVEIVQVNSGTETRNAAMGPFLPGEAADFSAIETARFKNSLPDVCACRHSRFFID